MTRLVCPVRPWTQADEYVDTTDPAQLSHVCDGCQMNTDPPDEIGATAEARAAKARRQSEFSAASRRLTCRLLGVEVTEGNRADLLRALKDGLRAGEHVLVVGQNLHSAYLYHTNPAFASVYDSARHVLADGRPVHLDAKLTARASGREVNIVRLGSTDWVPQFVREGGVQSVLVVGAEEESNREAVRRIALLSSAHVEGISGQDWDEAKSIMVRDRLEYTRPELVLIGLGMPLQEEFVARHLATLPPAIYALVGGAIDQLSGTQSLAPRWLGRFGAEWLWRLCANPRRLWRRYLLEPWRLVAVRLRTRRGASGR